MVGRACVSFVFHENAKKKDREIHISVEKWPLYFHNRGIRASKLQEQSAFQCFVRVVVHLSGLIRIESD